MGFDGRLNGSGRGFVSAKEESAVIRYAKRDYAQAWMRCIEGVDAPS
jgi:hypothetical protein